MAFLFAAAYKVNRPARPPDPNGTAAAFFRAVDHQEFPYDGGDDPAFFSARHHNGPVTWGICRPDVRRIIRPGDWMAFFAAEPLPESQLVKYRLAAVLLVQEKIRQTAIFEEQDRAQFRTYLNLVIRPREDGWEWFEPALNQREWHKDWLWRIGSARPGLKDQCVHAGQTHRAGTALPEAAGENYIVFSNQQSIVLHTPIPVAQHSRGEKLEVWNADTDACTIRKAIFGTRKRQHLRISNRQQPHRHIRRPIHDSAWLDEIRSVVQGRKS